MKTINGYIIIYYTALICFLSSCISVYEPEGVKSLEGILVVDGMIVDMGTIINLSRTVKLDNCLQGFAQINRVGVSDAIVHVIDEGNNVIAVAEPQITDDGISTPGTYAINGKITFMPDMKYALDILIDNKHYRSAFVYPVHTPEIDEVNWMLNDDISIDIMVSTHDPENKINYYRWAFEEDWEIISPLFAALRFELSTGEFIQQSLIGSNNRYYCWKSDKSKSLILGAYDKLSATVISNKKIHQFFPSHARYSSPSLYSILVKQYGLDNEAYGYFENLQRNVEGTGSIFAPQPSEKAGNIHCLTDPGEPVIGYVAISNATTYRLFIDLSTFDVRWDCSEVQFFQLDELYKAYREGFGLYDREESDYMCVSRICVDCIERGGTKKKPDFWPNDHQ